MMLTGQTYVCACLFCGRVCRPQRSAKIRSIRVFPVSLVVLLDSVFGQVSSPKRQTCLVVANPLNSFELCVQINPLNIHSNYCTNLCADQSLDGYDVAIPETEGPMSGSGKKLLLRKVVTLQYPTVERRKFEQRPDVFVFTANIDNGSKGLALEEGGNRGWRCGALDVSIAFLHDDLPNDEIIRFRVPTILIGVEASKGVFFEAAEC